MRVVLPVLSATPEPTPVPAIRESLLRVEDLSVNFITRGGVVKVLERVGFSLTAGERVAVVGESGSGKSVTAYALLGMLDPAARITDGRVIYRGRDLLAAPERDRRRARGREMAMIFQSPRAALNPTRTVGAQLADVLRRHHRVNRHEARDRAIALLRQVRLTDPARRFEAFPFELSGGMCQRVLIALALACEPSILVADEPTTGLDLTTQAAIVDLLSELTEARGMALLFITHDLPLATSVCRRVLVMHAGHVVEDAPVARLLAHPRHPYTARLLSAVPARARSLSELSAIPGSLPDLRGAVPPCRYLARCVQSTAQCDGPVPRHDEQGHRFACWNPL